MEGLPKIWVGKSTFFGRQKSKMAESKIAERWRLLYDVINLITTVTTFTHYIYILRILSNLKTQKFELTEADKRT